MASDEVKVAKIAKIANFFPLGRPGSGICGG
jgi:hypothetical protein